MGSPAAAEEGAGVERVRLGGRRRRVSRDCYFGDSGDDCLGATGD